MQHDRCQLAPSRVPNETLVYSLIDVNGKANGMFRSAGAKPTKLRLPEV